MWVLSACFMFSSLLCSCSVVFGFQSHHGNIFPNHVQRRLAIDRRFIGMNVFEDAFKFFSNMNKEASAKHILISGPGATEKLLELKKELDEAADVSAAFSEFAAKVSQCPSAARGGNLGTFKPGMMVKEFDEIVFSREVGVIHGPIVTQFGSHLVFITRRFEGEKK